MSPEEQLQQAFAYYARLKKVKTLVEQHLAEPIGLQDAARVASLEPKYFSKFFKEKTGVAFSSWLHDQRVARAMELLRNEEVSISSLATRVGYSDPKTFFRAFKARTGHSPSNYRERVRPADNQK